jgi:hypothetical protein
MYLEIYQRTTKPALTNSKDNEEPTPLNDKSETIKIENQSPKSNNDTSTRSCSC